MRLPLLLLPFLLTSCIEEYEIPDALVSGAERPLYIDGHIISGGNSTFFVAQATEIGGYKTPVKGAEIIIESDTGFRSDAAEQLPTSEYVVTTGVLNDAHRYRVVVKVGDETYASRWQTLQPAVDIDEVGYTEYADRYLGPDCHLEVWVSASAPDDAPRHYLYTYEENWEIEANDLRDGEILISRVSSTPIPIYYDPEAYPLLTDDSNPYVYCWVKRYSTDINLYSTAELSSNSVVRHTVRSINPDDERISRLYAIDVFQSTISDEAYDYYRLMERLTEDTGTLFAPTPQRLRGNVECVSHPQRVVYGYVNASSTSTKRLFIDPVSLQIVPHNYVGWTYATRNFNTTSLDQWIGNCLGAMRDGHVVATITDWPDRASDFIYLLSPTCYSCFARGGTKDKPAWWPNDHE